jgi:hypothetical protein
VGRSRRGPVADYWRSVAFGGLTASAELRHDALARLRPRTEIAGQVELEERFLKVRGTLREYRIHLGSGNILMSPDDACLCIVSARDKRGTLHLPFEDDVVLSKAFLLAVRSWCTLPLSIILARYRAPGGPRIGYPQASTRSGHERRDQHP